MIGLANCLVLVKAVPVEHYFNTLFRVSILCKYSLLYTTVHLQVPLIPKTKIFIGNDT